MDQAALVPDIVALAETNLTINGQINQTTANPVPRYKELGLITDIATLEQLISKPVRLDTITRDASSQRIVFFDLTAQTFRLIPFADYITNHFHSAMYDVRIDFHVTGHQFAVQLIGAGFVPTAVAAADGSGYVNFPGASFPRTILSMFETVPNTRLYNFVVANRGVMATVHTDSTVLSVECALPRNAPFNQQSTVSNIDHHYGSYFFCNISSWLASQGVVHYTVVPYLTLVNVRLMPWQQ